jgi:phage shock protein PspC (stress-responsive transcriptional regulator)
MLRSILPGHAGGMTETPSPTPPQAPSEPPGSTAVHPDPAREQSREEQDASRTGMDTEHLRDYRALRRDVADRKIAGVCGGLARHLDVDPTLVRVVMVVLALFGGAGLILYAVLWLFVPEEGTSSAIVPVGDSARNALIVVALVLAVLVALPAGLDGDGGMVVPVLVAAIVLGAVLLSRDASRHSTGGARPAAPEGAHPSGPAPGADPGWGSGVTIPPPPGAAHTSTPYPAATVRRGPLLFGITLASVALAVGILGLVDASGASVPDAAYPALALAVIGGWLVVGSVFGRPGGLALLGVLALVGLSATTLVEPTFEGERELVVRPASASGLDPRYDLPAGRAEIDLRGITDVESLDGRTLEVDVNAGEIVLIVPEGLTVDLDASVTAGGEISTPGANRGGWSVDVNEQIQGDDDRATMQADLELGFGKIHVRSE